LGLGNFAVGVTAYLPIGLLVPIARDLGVTHAAAGLLILVYAGFYSVSSPIFVNISSTWPRRAMLIISLGLLSVGILLTAFVHDWYVVLIGRAISAVGAGFYTPVAASTAFTLSTPENRGRNMSVVFFGIPLAQAAGVPIGILLEVQVGWEDALLSTQAIVILALISIFLTLPKRIGLPKPPARVRLLIGNRAVLICLGLTIAQVSSFIVMYTFLGPLSIENGRVDIFTLMLVIGVAAAVGSLSVGYFVDRIGPRPPACRPGSGCPLRCW